MSRPKSFLKSFRDKHYGVAPFWQKAAAALIAGSLTGGILDYLLGPDTRIGAFAMGVSAAMYFCFGKSAKA